MTVLAIPFHEIDPVALELGFISIRWYGLAYLAGLVLGWLYIRRLLSSDLLWAGNGAPMKPEKADDLLIWIMLGVVIGGRLGFVFFYEPSYFLQNPLDVFKMWQGGMAFHGGLLGTTIAIILFARRHNISVLSTGDLVAAAVPIGIFFGRLANFINGGLYGRVTDVPWAMYFPDQPVREASGRIVMVVGDLPRHPSQLYEAALEGVLIFFVLRFMIYYRNALKYPGLIAGSFLVLYGIGRSIAEFFREQDPGHFFNWGPLTAGMAYSIPMIVIGAGFIYYTRQRPKMS